MDSSGECNVSAVLLQNQNVIFTPINVLCTVWTSLAHTGQTLCQNDLTRCRVDFDPVCQPSQVCLLLLCQTLPVTAWRLCRGDAPASTSLIGHEMLLAPELLKFKLIGACHYGFSSTDWRYASMHYHHCLMLNLCTLVCSILSYAVWGRTNSAMQDMYNAYLGFLHFLVMMQPYICVFLHDTCSTAFSWSVFFSSYKTVKAQFIHLFFSSMS